MGRLIKRFDDHLPFDGDRPSHQLVSLGTGYGYVSASNKDSNADEAEEVSLQLQEMMDGMSFSTQMPTKLKVKPLSHLKKPVVVGAKKVQMNSLMLFHRKMAIGERELIVKECLSYELTVFSLTFFNEKQEISYAPFAENSIRERNYEENSEG